MKGGQLRRITVENKEYIYIIKNDYKSESGATILIIRMFLSGQKSKPLISHFVTFCDTLHGHPLYAGGHLLNHATNSMEYFIIHRPKYIRGFILEAIKAGWTGTNQLGIQNGIAYLNNAGFNTSSLMINYKK